MSGPAVADPLDALAAQHGAILAGSDPLDALAAQHGAVTAEPGTKSGLVMTATGEILPRTAKMAAQFVASKTAPYLGAKVGRVVGAISPVLSGATAGGEMGGVPGAVLGAITSVPAMAKGAWAGGKTGWFTTKFLQNIAKPVAATMEAAAPYAQILSTLGGAQGILDLAQMAEPHRKDIGIFGIGSSVDIPKDQLEGIYAQAVENGIKSGLTPSAAAARLANGDIQKFSAAMAAYMKSRMVK